MRRITPITLLMIVTASLGLIPGGAAPVAADEEKNVPSVPEIRTKDIDGNELSLHALLGKGPVLLDFWALWCRPCLKELVELEKLREKYEASGYTIIAVNTDTPVEVNKVKPYVRSRKYGFRVITDIDGDLRRKFQVNALPTALLIAPDGTTAWSNQGYRPGDEKKLEKVLTEILAKE